MTTICIFSEVDTHQSSFFNMTAVPLGGPSTGIPPVGVEGVETGNSAFMGVSEGAKVNFHPCQRPPTDADA